MKQRAFNKPESLASRGKKPMASLHTMLMEQLTAIPDMFISKMIKRKIEDAGGKAPEQLVQALVDHISNGEDSPFEWHDEHAEDLDLDIEIDAADVESVIQEIDDFNKTKLPDLIESVTKEAGVIILRSLERDWPEQKSFEEAQMEVFRYNLEERWGKAFDVLRMMYTVARELGNEAAKRQRRSRSSKQAALRETLLRLHARACQVTAEIICLMANGYADGAMARWRTLHEITVVASVIAQHGNGLAVRYLDHEAIEAKRAMDRFLVSHEALGYPAPSPREIKRVERLYEERLTTYGNNFGSQYGWAAHHLGLKKPRFDDLEVAAGKVAMRPHYQMASYNVHASSKGIAFRLGLLDGEGLGQPVALAGASNAGFSDPAQNTAQSLTQITGLLFGSNWRFDRMIEMRILLDLRDKLPRILLRAERRLERDHRQFLKKLRDRKAKRAR
ncbi:MAG TPA: DUF5677 domain-containing protein [Allosphingosinicella sp.]|nr:DUF5677 domain-containing protein [Allosphingosinicella sp.]